MELIIRDAVPEDSKALAVLNRKEMGYDYPEKQQREKLERLLADGRNRILVAQRGAEVVGYVHLCDYDVLYAPHMKNIMVIAVSSSCRRMGIGKALLEAAEVWARETGAAGIRLSSGETRKGAHAFYRSLMYEGEKMQLNLKKMFQEWSK